MADMKISDLPLAASVQDAQQFEVNDAGNSRRVTFQMLREKIKALADGWYAAFNHQHTAAQISNVTLTGQMLMTAPDAPAARGVIGAGTSNLAIGTTATTAKAGNWTPHVDQDTTGQLPWGRLSGVPNSVTNGNLPQALGVGSYVLAARTATGTTAVGNTLTASQITRLSFLAAGEYGQASLTIYTYPYGTGGDGGWRPPAIFGTWRVMGPTGSFRNQGEFTICIFLRIA